MLRRDVMSREFLSRFSSGLCPAVLCLCPLLLLGCGGEDDFFERREAAKFTELVDEYIDGYLQANPALATELGVHEYDDLIGPVDRDQIFGERKRLQDALQALNTIEVRFLSQDDKFDYQILDYHIQSELSNFDKIGYWARDPGYYDDLICRSIDSLLHHGSAPIETRVRSIIARENQIPAVLEGSRDIIDNIPRVLARIAADQFESSLAYFRDYLPQALEGVEDAALLEEFQTANDAVVAAYEAYLEFLNDEVVGNLQYRYTDFFLGTRNIQEKLLYDDFLEMTFSEIVEYGQSELERHKEAMSQAAMAIDESGDVAAILQDASNESPSADELFATVEEALAGAQQFVVDRALVTLPSDQGLKPLEMSSFLRPLRLVSLSVPGFQEPSAADAYLQLNLPDSESNARTIAAHMRSYNSSAVPLIAARQSFPGRYLHELRRKDRPTKVRQILQGPWSSDGWALYAEGMMLDQGYLEDDPRIQLERQRRQATAMARIVAGMNLHTLQMNFQEAVDFLMEEVHLDSAAAEREVRRAVRRPMSVVAGLRQRAIEQLRTDAEAEGVALKDFHDRLLSEGLPLGIHSLTTWSKPELRPARPETSSSN
jgi:uncharacterized protein (DUF885 family)